MKKLLMDLVMHQEWADAVQWDVLTGNPLLFDDVEIINRLKHIHFVQYIFMCVVTGKSFDVSVYHTMPEGLKLKGFAEKNHKALVKFVMDKEEKIFNDKVELSWFKDPPLYITIAEAILNVTSHSQYHRGQNARRFRLLNVEPPMTDVAVWYWKAKPQTVWNL